MNLILLLDEDRTKDGAYVLRDHRFAHVRTVLRPAVGDVLRVGRLDGPAGRGTVTALGDESVRLDVAFDDTVPPRPRTDLVLAVPRSRILERTLPQVAALGVDRLFLVNAWRVRKPYLSQRVLLPEAHRPLLHEGLMQGRGTHEPRVAVQPVFKPWIEDEAPALFPDGLRIVADPSATRDLAELPLPAADARVVVAIGPEGGWTPYEVEKFEEAGFTAARTGERILRVDTACVALLAQVALLRRMSLGPPAACGRLASP